MTTTRPRDRRGRYAPKPPDAKVSRCRKCGNWMWDGLCPLHPAARHDHYPAPDGER